MSGLDRLDLTTPQRAVLESILARNGQHFDAIIAYGSRTTPFARPGSDLDLAVIGPGNIAAAGALWLALEESDLPIFCDVVTVGPSLDVAIRREILRDGIVIAGNRMDDWRNLIP